MPLEILRHVEWDDEITHSIDFLYPDNTSRGLTFPCNKWGMVDPDIPIEAKENYRKCVDSGNMFIHQGIIEHHRDFKIPALAKCYCGKELELDGDTVCENCGREFNSAGTELAAREFWGEETGESFSEIH